MLVVCYCSQLMDTRLWALICCIPGHSPSYICTLCSSSTLATPNYITCCLYLLCSILNGFWFILYSSEHKWSPWSCFPACSVLFVYLPDMLWSPSCKSVTVRSRISNLRSVLHCHVKVQGTPSKAGSKLWIVSLSSGACAAPTHSLTLERGSDAVQQNFHNEGTVLQFGPLRCGGHWQQVASEQWCCGSCGWGA